VGTPKFGIRGKLMFEIAFTVLAAGTEIELIFGAIV
jgi:hypothetical protein